MGRFPCPACGKTINAFALTRRWPQPRRFFALPRTHCPKCDAPIRQRVPFSIVGTVFIFGGLLLLALVTYLVERPTQQTAIVIALLTWWVLFVVWQLNAPWVTDDVESNP